MPDGCGRPAPSAPPVLVKAVPRSAWESISTWRFIINGWNGVLPGDPCALSGSVLFLFKAIKLWFEPCTFSFYGTTS